MSTEKNMTWLQLPKHGIALWIALGCGALVIIAILCTCLMPQFFDVEFWKDFVSNALATLLGVFLGIPAALWLDRSISQRREKQGREAQQAAERERRFELLRLLRETLEKNREIIERMINELTSDSLIAYNVDTSLLESTASLKYEIIDDLELNKRLDTVRHGLQNLRWMIELRWEIELGPVRAMNIYRSYVRMLVEPIRELLPKLIEKSDEVIKLIDTELTIPSNDK